MLHIFQFIFNCLKSIFDFLNFNLPGIDLTFIDFVLLCMIIPLIFKLVKGAFADTNSGDGILFSGLSGLGGVSSTAKLSYDNFSSKIDSYRTSSKMIKDLDSGKRRISRVRSNHDEQLHQRHNRE